MRRLHSDAEQTGPVALADVPPVRCPASVRPRSGRREAVRQVRIVGERVRVDDAFGSRVAGSFKRSAGQCSEFHRVPTGWARLPAGVVTLPAGEPTHSTWALTTWPGCLSV